MDTLVGSIERITYYNPENGYTVLRLQPEGSLAPGLNREGLVTATGNLPELAVGEHLRLQGRWISHPKHGIQFQIEVCEQTLPATLGGIRLYLGSGLIKGIGPRLAERIVSYFGERTLEVIEEQPELLRQVPDIGPKRARLIVGAWEEQKQVKEIMLFLHSYGVSTNLATKIYKQYGSEALQVVRSDPYRLARDLFGVGFKTADRIARALGLAADHPSRIEAGVMHSLHQATDEGHVFMPCQKLMEDTAALLEVKPEQVLPAIERLVESEMACRDFLPIDPETGKLAPRKLHTLQRFGEGLNQRDTEGKEKDHIFDQRSGATPGEEARSTGEATTVYGMEAVYLAPLYYSEKGLAERLRALASALPSRLSDLPPAFVPLDPQLSNEQQAAIRMTLSYPVSVITGGPGTGKTTALKALIAVLESAAKRYALASPTGRAAKRLSQATGRSASTIHRLLAYKPGEGFKIHAGNPLPIDVLVVDEASMLDLHLAYNLLKALLPGTHLLLVGDVDQLPSVGAGDVLRDIILSGMAKVTQLNVIFRQAAHSHIITNAHRINQGQMPLFPVRDEAEKSDFFLFPAETPHEAADWVLEVTCKRIPQKFGLHPRDDVQVLSPMYRGLVGVTALNQRLQVSLNPPGVNKTEKQLFGQLFRRGDKLMQIQNNYDKEVYNGDIGYLFALDTIEHTLTVDFEGRAVTYDWSEADQLVLAYAISVHKSQGAEFPAVVVPMMTQHYMMLQRNLLYTAVTRARQLCVLVGSQRAIGIAVHNDKVAHRYTALDWRLRG